MDILEFLIDKLPEEDLAKAEELISANQAEFDAYKESAEAKFNEFGENEQALKDSIQDLKAKNYDLLMQTPKDEEVAEVEEAGEEVAEDGELEITIDDLFEDEEKGE